jgi:hypothetical protein
MTEMYVERIIRNEAGQRAWGTEVETFDLEADFSMDEQRLNYEICRMGQLMVKYGTLAAEQDANLKRKEEAAKLMQASVAGAIRSQAEKDGRKLTEAQLKEEVTIDDDYQLALAALHELRADAIKADHWWRTIVKKADLLNALAFKQNAEIKRMPG